MDWNESLYLGYAAHKEECDAIVEECLRMYEMGEYDFTVSISDGMTDADIEYIESEIRRRAGY